MTKEVSEKDTEEEAGSLLEYSNQLKSRIGNLRDLVYTNLDKSLKKQKAMYDKGKKWCNYQVCDWVLVLLPTSPPELKSEWKKNPGVRMSHNEGERGLTSIDGMCGASEQAIFCLQPFSKGQVGPGAASGSHYPLLYFRERGNDEESLDWASEWQSKECNPFKDWMEIEGGCDASEDVEDAEKSGRD
ncbi:hypothetical protein NDU88_005102 [Pleurodeles waltl]|uniref:Uncharacterized protein n=1 Tax=Pleurodeles waltl TaxID=8319 RepID=A0AAV7WYJ3_PLEWA|nr:hypothetical protein NDU88_005102 [Pleurodeles waltl]